MRNSACSWATALLNIRSMKKLTAQGMLAASLMALVLASAPAAAQTIDPNNTAPALSTVTAEGKSATGASVVSSADPRATAAGQEMLRLGGNAADAALATMLALTVVEPQSSGIGGGGFFVYHDAATGQIGTVDGRERAPASATPNLFMGADGKPIPYQDAYPGGKSVGVPGNIRLAAMAHQKWGKLRWAQLFAPAIKLADKGFVANEWTTSAITMNAKTIAENPDLSALYMPGGKAVAAGQTIRNPKLAALLRDVATKGPDAFYTGKNAQNIIDAVGKAPRNQAVMTLTDLKNYTATPRDAVCTTYRQYKLCGMGPPSSGATTVFQIMGMLEGYDLKSMGPNNPMSWHLIGEAMQLSYADRAKYLGDPDFVEVPVKGLLDKAYISSRASLISPFRALGTYEAGNPPGAPKRTAAIPGEVSGTSHFVAADKAGNVASMTSTVEGVFGSQLIANGFVLNNELTDFTFAPEENGAPVANRVEPGKRPLSSMSPTIVFGPDGKPILAVGSAGGKRIIMHVTKALVGVLDFGLTPEQALALPNLFYDKDGLVIENTPLGNWLAPQISAFGAKTKATDLGSKLNIAYRVNGQWQGVADPRSQGNALAN